MCCCRYIRSCCGCCVFLERDVFADFVSRCCFFAPVGTRSPKVHVCTFFCGRIVGKEFPSRLQALRPASWLICLALSCPVFLCPALSQEECSIAPRASTLLSLTHPCLPDVAVRRASVWLAIVRLQHNNNSNDYLVPHWTPPLPPPPPMEVS